MPNNEFHREHCHLSFMPVISVSDLVLSLVYYPLFHTLAPLMSAACSRSSSHVADVRVIACGGEKRRRRRRRWTQQRWHSDSKRSAPFSNLTSHLTATAVEGRRLRWSCLTDPDWFLLMAYSQCFSSAVCVCVRAQLSIKGGPRRGLVSTFGVENRYKRHRRLSRTEWSRRLEVNETEGNVSEVAVLSGVDSD